MCAFHEWNLDGLVEMCWEYLDLVRVYTKPQGKLPDFNDPVVLHRGKASVEDFCLRIHKSLVKDFKVGCVGWGACVGVLLCCAALCCAALRCAAL